MKGCELLLFVCMLQILLYECRNDLYTVLGISRTASTQDIRKAYRHKARETHPDKRQGDPDVAVLEFRAVVEAFETLSDESARRAYDRSGKTLSEQAEETRRGGNRNNKSGGGFGWQWNWRQSGQDRNQNYPKNHHRYLYDPYRRHQILDAQSRVVSVKPSMKHLRTVIVSEWDSDVTSTTTVLDRYILIAFFDSTSEICTNRLYNQILFPWPFAGFSSGEGSRLSGVWWEELIMTVKMDIASDPRTLFDIMELINLYGLDMVSAADGGLELRTASCPSIVMLKRGATLQAKSKAQIFVDYDPFADWVWQQLQVSVALWNRTPWPLDLWWLDGYVGKKQGNPIQPGEKFQLKTYLSHSFFARATQVTGNTLTNQSGLFWHTVTPTDDNKVFEIAPRCFDASGECVRWKAEGFCDRHHETFFTKQNPKFRPWVITACEVSCQTGCGAPSKPRQPPEL